MDHLSEFIESSDASKTNQQKPCDNVLSNEPTNIIETEYSVEECMRAIQKASKPKPMSVCKPDELTSCVNEDYDVSEEPYYMQLTRIRRELEDLWDEAKSTREKQEVDSLSNILDKLWLEKLSRFRKSYSVDPESASIPNSGTENPELYKQPPVESLPENKRNDYNETFIPLKVADFESRISMLEKRVGNAEEPLSMTIESCLQRLQAFEKNPLIFEEKISTWETIRNRLPRTGDNVNEQAGYKSNPSTPANLAPGELLDEKEYRLLSEILFVHLQDMENYQTLMPALLKRLKSLHCLHLETAETMNRWQTLESMLESTSNSLNQWNQLLKRLETSSFPEQSMNEIQTLYKRISNLEELCK
ncbi:dynactin complex subunit [Schizosaccharomyces cryophilus OY26]|uniref:Dynactin complex subunit n=1 Tax=Schizosaccharomyces cryophilus (strain OY26 / ATCC MYA-4695 / CBS 11777 / NBRC 106824 / NRRL Y48691) TaxID=653667 RepID=S9VTV6_SCHCR|nr:dynactin complex subunit [Schizosaccharomyces cryophilus OY26]EPY51298.1 dynactin complex subunit [Schizosaccharomyces cryophilus OY26]